MKYSCYSLRESKTASIKELAGNMGEFLKNEIVKINTRLAGSDMMSRIDRITTKVNEYGYDEFGFRPQTLKYTAPLFHFFKNKYFRTEVHGLQNVPKQGRVLFIGNHGGTIPWDGIVIGSTVFMDMDPPRLIRSMMEKFGARAPFFGNLLFRLGQIIGTPENCERLLRNEEAILVFPEGVGGSAKLYKDRYQLQNFGHGFMRLALKTNTPIIPVAVIGNEEQFPAIFNLKSIARLLEIPAAPITPTFPLLGILGFLPYPVKFRVYFGEPMTFEGDPDEEDTEIEYKVQAVKNTLQSMIIDGLHARKHIFW